MEGHPWVIVEAMAAGLPIVTTDHGCIRESVIDGKNGFLIPKKDPVAVAEKVNLLVENQKLRKQMGNKSRQLYEAGFTKEHFIRKMIDAIKLTLDNST
jgi:glycosyltransferase involved in cell wall biosynthesis